MYLKEKYENDDLTDSNLDINFLYTNIKIILVFILAFNLIPLPYPRKNRSSQIELNRNIRSNNMEEYSDTILEISNKAKEQIKNYLSSIPSKYEKEKNQEELFLNKFYALKNFTEDNKTNIEIKKEILENIFNFYKKKITKINNLFVIQPIALGNTMVCLNNIIYYCEVLGCKHIFLNSEYNWFIKNKIVNNKTIISVLPISEINCNSSKTLCIPFEGGLCLNPLVVKQKLRFYIIKNEIKRNLPKVIVHPDDLYIHIRCGYIFINDLNPSYSQPPLCFYQKILKNFKFKKIYIIAGNNNGPIIKKLLKEFHNVYYRNKSIELDYAYLSNAYNLVGSVSSFLLTAMKFNDNLKNYWEYDIYRKSEKFLHLHHDIYKYPKNFTIYKMLPSQNYKNEMFAWKNDKNQLKLMIQERCINSKFIIQKGSD